MAVTPTPNKVVAKKAAATTAKKAVAKKSQMASGPQTPNTVQ